MGVDSEYLADYRALAGDAGWVDMSDRTQLEIAGADRATFLHNLCTNDVKSLAAGEGREAFFTNVQGKVLAHAFLFAGADAIVLDTVPGQAAALLAHLDRYVIREDVKMRDLSAERGQVWLLGPRAEAELHRLVGNNEAPSDEPLAHARAAIGGADVEIRRAGWGLGYWISCKKTDLPVLAHALAAQAVRSCSREALESLRIESGFPDFGRDISDKNLPQEIDRNDRAISFKKGCYLGQETVARIDALGHVNRLLRRVRFSGDAIPSAGTELRDGAKALGGAKAVGSVTSAAFSPAHKAPLALAYIRRESAQHKQKLQSDAGEAEVLAAHSLEADIPR